MNTPKPSPIKTWWLVVAVLVATPMFIASYRHDTAKQEAAKASAPKQSAADRLRDDMFAVCAVAVERAAQGEIEWTNGWSPRFEGPYTHDPDAGTLMARGDKLKAQNTFGAWRKTSYVCIFDPKAGTARATIK